MPYWSQERAMDQLAANEGMALLEAIQQPFAWKV